MRPMYEEAFTSAVHMLHTFCEDTQGQKPLSALYSCLIILD